MIKMDMFSKKEAFINTRKNIITIIEETVDERNDDFSTLLKMVYEKCVDRGERATA
jgi:hypothetical protein